MKTNQPPEFDPSPATDKELASWTLSWQPEGRCGSFTRESILACAPPTSGVYGLFNFNCQIFIGESENIQEGLLRLESEPDFQAEQLRPMGFTFESCSAELRKAKAAELIAQFRPVLQPEAPSIQTRPPESRPMPIEVHRTGQESEAHSDNHEFPSHGEKDSQIHRRFQFRWDVALATALIASAAIIYFVKPADNPQKRVNGAGEKPAARAASTPSPASSKVGLGSKRQHAASNDAVDRRTQKNTEPPPAKPYVHARASSPDGSLRLAGTKASAADEAGVQTLAGPANTIPTAHSPASVNSGKKWSVQISAAPGKDVADSLVQRLIAKGYDSYVAQAEVKGQTYYRVRVGPFDAREEAEAARQSLAREEKYRESYLTGD